MLHFKPHPILFCVPGRNFLHQAAFMRDTGEINFKQRSVAGYKINSYILVYKLIAAIEVLGCDESLWISI